jgi:hypothetical protein
VEEAKYNRMDKIHPKDGQRKRQRAFKTQLNRQDSEREKNE